MTTRKLMKSLTLLAACSALTAQAGVAPAPAADPPPPSSIWSGSVTLGYDTDYLYRGFRVYGGGDYAEHLFTGALDLNVQVNDRLTWNFNAWYGNSVDDASTYDEIDLYTRLLYKVNDSFSFGPSFKYYNYPVFNGLVGYKGRPYDEQYEPGLEFVWVPCPNTTVNLGTYYETESDAFYVELGVNRVFKINDMVSIVPGAAISYVDRDESAFAPESSDFNHAALYVKVPITLRSNVTLTPYIAANFPFDAVDELTTWFPLSRQDNEIFGGVTLSVSF